MTTSDRHFSTFRLARAAERLRLHGIAAEEAGHTNLANLCWRKRIEALSELTSSVARDARAQHQFPRRVTKAETQHGRLM